MKVKVKITGFLQKYVQEQTQIIALREEITLDQFKMQIVKLGIPEHIPILLTVNQRKKPGNYQLKHHDEVRVVGVIGGG